MLSSIRVRRRTRNFLLSKPRGVIGARLSRCYGAGTSGRSPWGGDTARRRFIGGGRALSRFFHNASRRDAC